MADQATFAYAGLSRTAGWTLTLGVGITPSKAVATFGAKETIPSSVGDIVLNYKGGSITFRDCRVSQLVRAGRKTQRVTFEDRRWKWQFGKIDGSYNEKRKVNGSEVIDREKTPQELASLLLTAMGEQGPNVSNLPDQSRPSVSWVASNPAEQLQSLCSSLGCLIVYNPFSNRVELHRVGQGGSLPSSQLLIQGSNPIDTKAQPDELRVVTGTSLFQAPLALDEAVGIDTDGSIKPIDDLSYKPAGGWESEDPFDFPNVTGTYMEDGKTLNTVDLARTSVYRMYRVTGLVSGGWSPQALSGTPLAPSSLKDIEVQPFQIRTREHPDGEKRRELQATAKHSSKDLSYSIVPEGSPIEGGISVDSATGVATFSDPVFLQEENATVTSAAEIDLHAAFVVKSKGVRVRHEEFLNANGQTYNAGAMVLHHPEIIREVIEGYQDGNSDNLTEVEQEAGYYLSAVNARFSPTGVLDASYAGLLNVSLDGVNRQVTWSGGAGRPGTTRISQNQEHNSYVPSFEEQEKAAERNKNSRTVEGLSPEVRQ